MSDCLCVVEAVREVVCCRLLPAWLLRLDGNIIELLHRLDVENCAQTALDTLKAIFKGTPTEELLQNRAQLDNRYPSHSVTLSLWLTHALSSIKCLRLEIICVFNRKLIPVDSLTCENVLYWRALCEFIKTKGDDGDEILEQVLPDAATYADYLYG